MASQWPPKKNTAFTLYFTLYKNDGTVVANPGTITKKVSIDGAAVGDIAAAITEEDTTYGQCSVVLSASEMNGDAIWVYITDNTTGTVPFTCTLYTVGSTQDEVKSAIDTIDGIVDDILVDTGTTLDTLIKDIPTVSEFEARTLAAADYTIVSDLGTVQTGDAYAIVNNGTYGNSALKTLIDTVDNFVDTEISTLTSELAKVPKSDSTVTWNATALASIQTECTDALNAYDPPTKTEMDSAFSTTNGKIDAIKAKTDSLTFTVAGDVDCNVQTWKGSTAPAMTGDAYAVVSDGETGCVPTAYSIAEIITSIAKIPKSDSAVTWNATALGSIQSECADALNAYDPPTKAEMDSAFATTDGYIDTEITAISSTITTMDGKVDSILEDTGTTLPAAISGAASGLWNVLLTALTTTGSIGKALADWLVARPAGSTAFTASDVAVCNNALLLVGNTSITALTDDTKAAKLCLQFYQQSLDAVLRAYTWNCATVRSAALTATTAPTFGFSYAFTLPTDCLRVLMIEDDQTIPFKVESGVLLTDESTCKISYIKRITPDDADSLLLEAISARLAATIAFPLTNSTSASEAMWKLYEKKLDEAQSVDAFEGTAPQMSNDDWINSRS